MLDEVYLKKAKLIWKNFVPKTGQAEFEQGELLRAIEKLRDEAQRNGNANFNDKCHLILIEFLREKLTDRELFSEQQILQINSDLDRLKDRDTPYLNDDLFDRICYRVIDWCESYSVPIPHQVNPELYC